MVVLKPNRIGLEITFNHRPGWFTFWHIAEYFKENNLAIVASFKFSAGFENDLSLVDIVNPEWNFSNSETVNSNSELRN